MNTESPPPPDGPPLACPKCRAVAAKAARLMAQRVLVRCGNCGELWSVPERRKARRENRRATRFPLPPRD